MKNLLEYYYNIYPDKIYVDGRVTYFFIDDIKYYLVPFNRSIDDLNSLVEITNRLYLKGIKVHTFIKTKDNDFYVNNNDTKYILLRVNTDENEELDIYEIIKFNNLGVINDSKLTNGSWITRWENTVDAFEKQVTELNKEYPELLNVFDYYVGLAENAISYINNISFDNTKLYLSHKRIKTPLITGMLYNPLGFIFDYKVRDLAEYIKESFFYSELNEEGILEFLDENIKNYNLNDIKLLYGRLLYPTYYFDLFEGILNKEKEERELKKIVSLSKHYEFFLKELYFNLKIKYNIEPIDWIVNLE